MMLSGWNNIGNYRFENIVPVKREVKVNFETLKYDEELFGD